MALSSILFLSQLKQAEQSSLNGLSWVVTRVLSWPFQRLFLTSSILSFSCCTSSFTVTASLASFSNCLAFLSLELSSSLLLSLSTSARFLISSWCLSNSSFYLFLRYSSATSFSLLSSSYFLSFQSASFFLNSSTLSLLVLRYCFLSSSFFLSFSRFSASCSFLAYSLRAFSCFIFSKFYFSSMAYFYLFMALSFSSSAKAAGSGFILWIALCDWLLRSFLSFLLLFSDSLPGVITLGSWQNQLSYGLPSGSYFILASVSCLGSLGLMGFGIWMRLQPSLISTQGVMMCILDRSKNTLGICQ